MARRTIGTGAIAFYLLFFWGLVAAGFVVITSNAAPGAPQLAWKEAEATTTTKLTVEIATEAPDANGDSIKYAYSWTRNGEPEPERSSNSVSSRDIRKDETWTVTVVPDDGTQDGWGCTLPWRECAGEASATLSITVGNTPPRARLRFTDPEGNDLESFDGKTDVILSLSCFDPDILNAQRDEREARKEAGLPEPEPELDADGNPVPPPDPCTYTVAWWPADEEPEEGAEAPYTEPVLPRDALKKTTAWRAVVIANDGEDDGEPVEETIRKTES
ncbi:MAG: hypothetical protein H6732_08005 [Alphaproteobacteria bacterium]|nr:hypothetical protein [Alphaproteobacteria bacterium]